MRTSLRLGAYGGALALVFAGALGIGGAVGQPLREVQTTHGSDGGVHGARDTRSTATATSPSSPQAVVAGLAIADRGLALRLTSPTAAAGPATPLVFRVVDDHGRALTRFEESHEERMHLIAVRRDTSGFQHVHPTMAPDGAWTAPLALDPGVWRVFADFVPAAGPAAGESLTLGADLSVAGSFAPVDVPVPSRTAGVDDYEVTLAGDLEPGQEGELTLTVSRDGRPVTDLQPYLGAYGHLVALRVGDLAYLHVHPDGAPGDGTTRPGPDVTFSATAPTPGTYRLFLDFRHEGRVRTAAFTVEVAADGGVAEASEAADATHGSDGHDH